MKAQFAGLLLIAFAITGVLNDAASTPMAQLAGEATTVRYFWIISNSMLAEFQVVTAPSQEWRVFQSRTAQLFLNLPIWFLLAGLGYGLIRLSSQATAGITRSKDSWSRTIARACSYLLMAAALLCLVVDSYPPGRGQIITHATIATVLTELNLFSAADIEVFGQSFLATSGFSIGNILAKLPIWHVLFLSSLLMSLSALHWRQHTMDDEGSLSQSRKANELGQAPHACELKHAFNSIRSSFWYVGVFSGAVNILMLTGALFMLEVYDRVLPSQSFPTLLALAILVLILLSAQGLLDVIRNRMLVRLGNEFTRRLETRAIDLLVRLPLRSDRSKGMSNPIAELDVIRSFIGGPGLTSLFDLPWIPVYLAVIYALHPWLGWTAIAGAAVLIGLTLVTEMCSRQSVAIGARANSQRNQLAAAMSRNSEAVVTMAMLGNMTSRWQQANHEYAVGQRRTSDISMGLGSLSKTLRLMLQSMVLAVGAFLVIRQEASAGVIIAGAILTARALAPVDMAIGQWKAFVAARQSWQRLKDLLDLLPPTIEPMILPAPSRTLELQRVSTTPPGDPRLVVHDINAILHRGQGLGIVGPSGSGKSSLVRLIVGLWPPVRGRLLLDNAELHNWSTEHLGHHIGYLPQSVELFEGSVAENIARFAPDADAEDIIAAARTAGVHELIMTFPEGYETNVGEQGSLLSVGQRQRIALARALFRDPFLVVLDEPNSNLDAEGDLALQMAMKRVRARGGIVVMVAHRAAALNSVDIVLAIRDGKALAYGPRDEVLSQIKSNHQQTAISQIRVVPEADQVRDRSTGDVQ